VVRRSPALPAVGLSSSVGTERARIAELGPASASTLRYASVGRGFVLAYCLTVFVLGLTAGALAAVQATATAIPTAHLVVVVALAVGSLALSAVSERRRGQLLSGPSWDVHSVWLLTAVLLLPIRVALLMSLLLLVQALWVRRVPTARAGLYWGAAVLAMLAARAVGGWVAPELTVLRVLGAAAALLVVQGAVVLALSRMVLITRSWATAVGEPAGLLAEASALALGALLSVAIAADASFAVLAVPVLLLIEGSSHVPLLRRSAQLDAKTGLQSTLHWQNQAAERLATARQHSRSAALVLLDVDRFKTVNDSVGHVAGDAVLAAVAQASAGQLRSGDVIGRFGGDEIVALLVSATTEQAGVVGDRMRSAVSDLQVMTRGVDGSALRVDGLTVSVGVAGTDENGFELPDLLLAADGALLQAKRTGRNRVCTA